MKTIDDPILVGLYRFREEYAATFNNDVSAMMEELIREQDELEKQGRKFVAYPPRRCQQEFPFARIEDKESYSAPPIDTTILNPDAVPGVKGH